MAPSSAVAAPLTVSPGGNELDAVEAGELAQLARVALDARAVERRSRRRAARVSVAERGRFASPRICRMPPTKPLSQPISSSAAASAAKSCVLAETARA